MRLFFLGMGQGSVSNPTAPGVSPLTSPSLGNGPGPGEVVPEADMGEGSGEARLEGVGLAAAFLFTGLGNGVRASCNSGSDILGAFLAVCLKYVMIDVHIPWSGVGAVGFFQASGGTLDTPADPTDPSGERYTSHGADTPADPTDPSGERYTSHGANTSIAANPGSQKQRTA